MLAFSSVTCYAFIQPHRASMAVDSSSSCFLIFFLCMILFSPPLHLSLSIARPTFLPSPRPGVPLGTKAICRGGGRASAQEQQADDGQQLSGGTLRGSVFLSTLGEYRKERRRTKFFRFLLFCLPNSVSWCEERASPAERSRKRQSSSSRQIRERSRRVEATLLCLCVYINSGQPSLSVLSPPPLGLCKVGIGNPAPLTSPLSLSPLDLLISSKGHDSVMHERRYIIGGLFLMRCSAGAPRPVSTAAARAAASETVSSER